MNRVFLLIVIILSACNPSSKVETINPIAEANKDLIVLSKIISKHLLETNGTEIKLDELIQKDTLKRIANNFEKIEFSRDKSGRVLVAYKFSKSRNTEIEINGNEKPMLYSKAFIYGPSDGQFDGRIQFAFPERFYHVMKVIVYK